LAEAFAEHFADDASDDVDAAPRRIWHDQRDEAGRIVLRKAVPGKDERGDHHHPAQMPAQQNPPVTILAKPMGCAPF
jgi:hypothetical protein